MGDPWQLLHWRQWPALMESDVPELFLQALQCHCPCSVLPQQGSNVKLELHHRGNSVCHTADRNKARGGTHLPQGRFGRRICAPCCAPQRENSTERVWSVGSVILCNTGSSAGWIWTHRHLLLPLSWMSQELSWGASPRDAFLACTDSQVLGCMITSKPPKFLHLGMEV